METLDLTRLGVGLGYLSAMLLTLAASRHVQPSRRVILYLGAFASGAWVIWFVFMFVTDSRITQNLILVNQSLHFLIIAHMYIVFWRLRRDNGKE